MKYRTIENTIRDVVAGRERQVHDVVHRMRFVGDKIKAKYPNDKDIAKMVDDLVATHEAPMPPIKRASNKGVSLTTKLERVRKYTSEED
jgi:hypothetical protein